jgi:predicted metal-dependent enzyme (double-stranded beta helix superfamily)
MRGRARSISESLDLQLFLDDCQQALAQQAAPRAMRELVARAVSEPAALIRALGEPRRAGIQTLHRSPTLTVLNVVWAPGMSVIPHDHRVWAVIGIYVGREDNIFWRRLPEADGGKIEHANARSLEQKEAVTLGRDIIHSVYNPVAGLTGALHVYGGDFFAVERSEWNADTLLEQPYDMARALRTFEDGNLNANVKARSRDAGS